MASSPLRADSACIKHFAPVPPAAISRVLSRFDRDQLAGFIAVAIDLLDLADGDPEVEDDGTAEPDGDEGDCAWSEWDRRSPAGKRAAVEADGFENCGRTEDDEDDDPREEDDPAGQCDEDGINTGSPSFWLHGSHCDGPGCPIADGL